MTTEERIQFLLTYHEQLTREFTATCFDYDLENQEYSADLKESLRKVNELIQELLLPECMPF